MGILLKFLHNHKTKFMPELKDAAQEILELAKVYAADVDAMTNTYQDAVDVIDQQISSLLDQRKELTNQFVKDVAARSAQFVADVKAILDAESQPHPEPV